VALQAFVNSAPVTFPMSTLTSIVITLCEILIIAASAPWMTAERPTRVGL
jgi:hypothetical protein